jgi:hypothetical protein
VQYQVIANYLGKEFDFFIGARAKLDNMIIDRIELYHVAMPLIYPWRTAYGEDSAIHSLLLRMCSGSVDAWGESAPLAASRR